MRWMTFLVVAACSDAPVTGDSGVVGSDGGADAGGVCTSMAACDDGLFCNGAEECTPGASPSGCVAGAVPCAATQTCNEDTDHCDTACDVEPDADGDGADAIECGGSDCDDSDRTRYPGATEICDAADVDEDCDPSTFGLRDADEDMYPDAMCCNDGEGGRCGTDCDDTLASINPATGEICNGRDDDCDMNSDEGVTAMLCADGDGDMFGDAALTMMGCPGLVAGYVADCTDCDDEVGSTHPGAAEACDAAMVDDDCDMMANEACTCSDGMTRGCMAPGVCAAGVETCVSGRWAACSIAPEPFETCDLEDDDCNGVVDDGLRRSCFGDSDGDGFAASGTAAESLCATGSGGCPSGTTSRAPMGADIDCDDATGSRAPGLVEVCDTVDQNCNGMIDEGLTVVCYVDADNDSYAPTGAVARNLCPISGREAVGGCPLGNTNRRPASAATRDCNDTDYYVRPTAIETCNMTDDDCDGTTDEGSTVSCYADGDDDTFAPMGAAAMTLCRDATRVAWGYCPGFYTSRTPADAMTRDCNDAVPSTFPGALEICDAIDQDCDGSTTDVVMITCYRDVDDDTYAALGAASSLRCPVSGRDAVGGCETGYTNRNPSAPATQDCADSDRTINPGAVEMCSSPAIDQNCNGNGDEGLVTCWADPDRDGYAALGLASGQYCRSPDPGRAAAPWNGCAIDYTGRDPATRATADCDPASATPGRDQPFITCYGDADADSYAPSIAAPIYQCPNGTGFGGCAAARTSRSAPLDCCDADSNVRPGQTAGFASARAPACGAPAFDYDCDGTETKLITDIYSGGCSGSDSGSCLSSASFAPEGSWPAPGPNCGIAWATTVACQWVFYIGEYECQNAEGPLRTQICR